MDIMTEIREGMHVVDTDGKDVGKVRDFQAGDPEAVTVDGATDDPLVMGGPLGDTDLPRHEAERLIRLGWVKIHKGLFTGDRFVSAEELDRVEDDKLLLRPGVHLK